MIFYNKKLGVLMAPIFFIEKNNQIKTIEKLKNN